MAQFKTLVAVGAVAVSAAFAAQAQGPDPKPSAAVMAAVADPERPQADKARDDSRKPAELVAASGLKPGQVVAELNPAGGYFTRILARAVGPDGKVIAVINAARPQAADPIKAMQATYPNLSVTLDDYAKLTALPEKVDMVWTTDNYHDFHNALDMAAFDKAVFDALKPGGVFLVEDHAAAPGAGATATRTLHRIEPATVRQEVTAAGFKLVRTSAMLANPADEHTVGSGDASLRGRTDRFVMVFRKP